MIRRTLCTFTLMLALGVMAPSALAQDIVLEGAKLTKLFEASVWTEGVAVTPNGMVYFSDITFSHLSTDETGAFETGSIWKYNPKTEPETTDIFRSPSGMSNGIKFDALGNMIICEGADSGGQRIIRTDMKSGKSYVVQDTTKGDRSILQTM